MEPWPDGRTLMWWLNTEKKGKITHRNQFSTSECLARYIYMIYIYIYLLILYIIFSRCRLQNGWFVKRNEGWISFDIFISCVIYQWNSGAASVTISGLRKLNFLHLFSLLQNAFICICIFSVFLLPWMIGLVLSPISNITGVAVAYLSSPLVNMAINIITVISSLLTFNSETLSRISCAVMIFFLILFAELKQYQFIATVTYVRNWGIILLLVLNHFHN